MNAVVTACLLLALTSAAPAAAQTLEKIRKDGVIRLGYIDGAAPFSSSDGAGGAQGYSADICRAVAQGIAAQLKRPELKTRWVKLDLQNRMDAVRRKEVDIECSTTTWTLSRQRVVDFSLVTFLDGGSVLSKTDAGLSRLADFNGRRIAVIAGTTTEKALAEALAERKLQAQVVTVKQRDEGFTLLRESQVDGFASDRTTLITLAQLSSAGGASYRLLDEDFSIEQYALMLPRGDPDFRLAVNRVLARLYRSREIEDIYQRSLGPLGAPSVLLTATYFIQSLSE
jgi:ABC-type amino acid transport substrate-binding protein